MCVRFLNYDDDSRSLSCLPLASTLSSLTIIATTATHTLILAAPMQQVVSGPSDLAKLLRNRRLFSWATQERLARLFFLSLALSCMTRKQIAPRSKGRCLGTKTNRRTHMQSKRTIRDNWRSLSLALLSQFNRSLRRRRRLIGAGPATFSKQSVPADWLDLIQTQPVRSLSSFVCLLASCKLQATCKTIARAAERRVITI